MPSKSIMDNINLDVNLVVGMNPLYPIVNNQVVKIKDIPPTNEP